MLKVFDNRRLSDLICLWHELTYKPKKELISKPKDNNHSFKIRKDTKQALPAVSSINE